MSSLTKAKINLKEGIIELEGSEAFVTKHIEMFQEQMKKTKTPEAITAEEESNTTDESKKSKKSKSTTRKSPPVTVTPISLDLKQSDNKPSLRTFVKEKSPSQLSEKVVVFAYYLKKYLNIQKMEAGHVVSCCKEIKCRVPRRISQMFYDIERRLAYVKATDSRKYAVITTAGENFVEFDLPRKKDVATNKAAT